MSCFCEDLKIKLNQIEQLVIQQNQLIQQLRANNEALEQRVVALEELTSEPIQVNITDAIKQAFGLQ